MTEGENNIIDEQDGVPAADPVDEQGTTFVDLFLSQYIAISAVFTGDTREPRTVLAMRQKAADVALNLTFKIIDQTNRGAV